MNKLFVVFMSLMFIMCLVGCDVEGGGTKMNYEIGYLEETGIFDKNVEIEIVRSYNQWQKLACKKDELNFKYSEEYFEENIVIIYNFQKSVKGNEFSIKNVSFMGKELIVEIEIKEGYMDSLSSGTLILELSQNDGKQINNVSIKEIIIK